MVFPLKVRLFRLFFQLLLVLDKNLPDVYPFVKTRTTLFVRVDLFEFIAFRVWDLEPSTRNEPQKYR